MEKGKLGPDGPRALASVDLASSNTEDIRQTAPFSLRFRETFNSLNLQQFKYLNHSIIQDTIPQMHSLISSYVVCMYTNDIDQGRCTNCPKR